MGNNGYKWRKCNATFDWVHICFTKRIWEYNGNAILTKEKGILEAEISTFLTGFSNEIMMVHVWFSCWMKQSRQGSKRSGRKRARVASFVSFDITIGGIISSYASHSHVASVAANLTEKLPMCVTTCRAQVQTSANPWGTKFQHPIGSRIATILFCGMTRRKLIGFSSLVEIQD